MAVVVQRPVVGGTAGLLFLVGVEYHNMMFFSGGTLVRFLKLVSTLGPTEKTWKSFIEPRSTAKVE